MLINKIETNRNWVRPFTRAELSLNIREKELTAETIRKLVHR